MSDVGPDEPDASSTRSIRAHRFELIDGRGRVRAVLGDVGGPDSYVPGLALLDGLGHQRACLALFPHGPSLAFVVGGNDVLNIGVMDGEAASDDLSEHDPTAYIVLSDGLGSPRASIRVHHDGRTRFE